MSEQKQTRRLSFSRDALKWIGFVCLLIGALGNAVIKRGLMQTNTMTAEELEIALQSAPMSQWYILATVTTLIHSVAIPIYARLFADGWKHTASRKKYMIRLVILAVVSEFAYDWTVTGSLINSQVQNPLWGLLIAAVVLSVFAQYEQANVGGTVMKVSAVLAAVLWVWFLQVEMGIPTVLLVFCFCLLPDKKYLRLLCSVAAALLQLTAVIGLVPAWLYDGSESKCPKWLYYAMYPAALVISSLIALLV